MWSAFTNMLNQYTEALLDFIYPQHIKCIVCNRYLRHKEKHSICSKCLKEISFIGENSCTLCAKPLSHQGEIDICKDCEETVYFFQRAVAVVEYKGVVKDLMFRFKYYDATYLSRDLASMMTAVIEREELRGDILMAVPLHRKKEKQRGYNQSYLLAKYVGRNMGVPLERNNLLRVKSTKVLHNLSKRQRQENLRGAFQVKDPQAIEGKDILLIDDIFTTGTTANACSRVLMEGGAKSVTVATFARGV